MNKQLLASHAAPSTKLVKLPMQAHHTLELVPYSLRQRTFLVYPYKLRWLIFRSKENTKSIIGIQGVRTILEDLAITKQSMKTVAIGGINASNVERVMFQTRATAKGLDGVAIVSG